MRKGLTFVAFATISSFAQAQVACATFDREELNEMSQQELVREYCTALQRNDKNITDKLDASLAGNRASDMYAVEASKCRNEADRIGRVLKRQGVEATYQSLCMKT